MNNLDLGFDKICRVCMRARRLTPIFGRTTKAGASLVTSKDFSIIITCYAAVKVSRGDGLPQNICYGCITLLNSILYFKNVCERSYAILQSQYLREIHRTKLEDSPECGKSSNTDSGQDNVVYEQCVLERPTNACDKINTCIERKVPTFSVKEGKEEKQIINDDNYSSSQEYDDTNEPTSDITDRKMPVTPQRKKPVRKMNKTNNKIQSLIDSVRVNKRPRKLIGSKQKQKELTHIQRNARLREIATLRKDKLLKDMILRVSTTKKMKMNPELSQKIKSMFRVVKKNVLITGTKNEKVTNLVQCRECSVVLQQRSMKMHYQKHTGYKYICEHCGNRFVSEKVMEQHCMARHGKEKTYECKICGYRTAYKSELTVHERSHTGERPFICDMCGFGFHRRQCLTKHITLHSQLRPYQCEYCSKTFRNKNDIPGHINSLHHRRYVYQCTECDATYAKLTSVRRHLVTSHRVPREQQGKVPRIQLI